MILEPRVKQLLAALPKDKTPPSQCQFDAMLSIVFNRGIGKKNGGGFKSSDFYQKYVMVGNYNGKNEKEKEEIRDLIINDNSKLKGSQRRKNEEEMYFNCKY